MSFSCPHFHADDEHCLRLNTDCVPGRRGCVIPSTTVFALPAEERVRLREDEKRQARDPLLRVDVEGRENGP